MAARRSCWAEAAERNGYLVCLTPFLPGAINRMVALNFMSNQIKRYKPMQLARTKECITELVTKVTGWWIPSTRRRGRG
jgi:hypothetical protein